MSLALRAAGADDVPAIVAVKRRLRLTPGGDAESGRGGFLLGTTHERYAELVAAGRTQVLVDGGAVVGFAVALPDAALRASELWRRRVQIAPAGVSAAALEALVIGYLDQLAVLPDPKYSPGAAALAYHAVAGLFAEGCALVVTTVVATPVRNLASRRLLAAAGALQIGTIEEEYPEVGTITSDVFALLAASLDPDAQDDARRRLRLHRLAAAARRLADAGCP